MTTHNAAHVKRTIRPKVVATMRGHTQLAGSPIKNTGEPMLNPKEMETLIDPVTGKPTNRHARRVVKAVARRKQCT